MGHTKLKISFLKYKKVNHFCL